MDENIVIKVENISKKFSKSLKRGMLYGASDILKNAVGIKAKSEKLRKSEFWAVNDVSFELKKGEVLGIIGPNGSGKTTILKMLNGIFWPDKGKISVKGKVGALIAAGVGFHPNLTGRENIYINGSILGMNKRGIDKKIDKIIEFADIGGFIDVPVKFYSSGMKIRIGFSSAIFIEPEILLIDEILAVGDINFRRKAANELKKIRRQASTIFISHNLREVSRLCDRAILLENGKLKMQGGTDEVINYYINREFKEEKDEITILEKIKEIENIYVRFENKNNQEERNFIYGDKIITKIFIKMNKEIKDFICNILIIDSESNIISATNNDNELFDLNKGKNVIIGKFEDIRLLPGRYNIKISLAIKSGGKIADIDCGTLNIKEQLGLVKPVSGIYREKISWQKIR